MDSDVSDNPYIKLEYIKYPTLADIWLYSNFSSDFWVKIIDDLFEIIHKFNRYYEDVTIQEYNSIYFEKTIQRIDELIKSKQSSRQHRRSPSRKIDLARFQFLLLLAKLV